jgi:RimJ/RimL family protein N-acetyltransferase
MHDTNMNAKSDAQPLTDGHVNHLGQPIGFPIRDRRVPPIPPREPMAGHYALVEPLDPFRHARDLFESNATDREQRLWTYLSYGPFSMFEQYLEWARAAASRTDEVFHAIIDRRTGHAAGVAAYLRMAPEDGSIEVGHINLSPALQRTPAATEAMYLLMKRAFELGYRRYEWKCDALNAPSRRAAQRLGLSFEGVFRQATVYKGRNRDTAWYAAIDAEWPALTFAFQHWLDPANFDAMGNQRTRLSELTAPILKARG